MKTVKKILIGGGVVFLLFVLLGVVVDYFDLADVDDLPQEEVIVRDSTYIADSIKQAEEIAIKQAEEAKAKAAEEREKLIKQQFSTWDGSHRKIVKYLKKSMNDEDSFEHISTVYYDEGETLLVITKFSGKNGFNATIKQTLTARVDLQGNVIEVVSLK